MADDEEKQQGHFANEPSPGEQLRAARRDKNLDTKEVAATLNVDPWMLDALEHDEYGALGAPVFAKGHLRKYALALGLDADDLMVAYYQRAGTREAPPLIAESIMRVEASHGPRLTWLAPTLGVLILAIAALGVFLYLKPDGAAEPARAAAVVPAETSSGTARSTALRLPGANSSVPLTREVTSNPPSDAPEVSSDTPLDVLANDTPPPQPAPVEPPSPVVQTPPSVEATPSREPSVRETAATPPATTIAAATPQRDREPEPASGASDRVTVTLSFRDESWVEVYDRNRTKLLYGMGDPGSTRSIAGPAPLNVFLGKAGEVTVKVEGRDFAIPRISRLGTARFEVAAP